MRIAMLDYATIDHGDIDLTSITALSTHFAAFDLTPPELTSSRIGDADIVITNKVMIDTGIINAALNLKLICIAATGTNNVDQKAAQERGIRVANVRGYATPSVVQHVFCGLLMLLTRMPDYVARVRNDDWCASPSFSLFNLPINELSGLTLGIVGYGELGRAIEGVAKAFGMATVIAEHPGTPAREGRTAFNEVLSTADVVSLHCPLTDHTRGLIGSTQLAMMRQGAILVNTARGGIVDETALAATLRSGHLGGAVVDVLTTEPPPPNHPLLATDIPNLLLTPHNAWASRQARQRLVNSVATNIRDFLGQTNAHS